MPKKQEKDKKQDGLKEMMGISKSKDDQIKELLEQNLELTKKMYKLVDKVHDYIFWQKIFGVVKFIIIVVPIIVMVIILPPILKDLMNQYKSILGISSQVGELNEEVDLENVDLDDVPEGLKKYLK